MKEWEEAKIEAKKKKVEENTDLKYEKEFFEGSAELGCGTIVCPSDRLHLFYLIHHTYRHLISGGIGLRQMMDVYFALASRNRANDEWLEEQIKDFGMNEFAEAMVWVMREVFGMEIAGLPWMADEREGRFLLDERALAQ